eukprot:TRINITY_DN31363_c0_g1_i1.p1 TRINITY_DN31363_c0_g1~~TRINITY_DN31363_c0_g1_i1.p1  ORF type:complete len:832 (+),score=186.81 TRINITY_DN31363_c0_g1_i1:118-2613(+)
MAVTMSQASLPAQAMHPTSGSGSLAMMHASQLASQAAYPPQLVHHGAHSLQQPKWHTHVQTPGGDQGHVLNKQPKWHKHLVQDHDQEQVMPGPLLRDACETEFCREDSLLRRGLLDAAQCRRAFGQVLLRLWPEGTPSAVDSDTLDTAFSELDVDLDGLLSSLEFQVLALRGMKPIMRSADKKGRSPKGKRPAVPPTPSMASTNPNLLPGPFKAPPDTAQESAAASAASILNSGFTPLGLKDPGMRSRAVGFANSALVPSARDLAAFQKDYAIPSGDASLGQGAFGTVLKVTHHATGEVRACKAVLLGDGQSAESAQLRELVELEVSMLKSLDHINLLRLHEAFRDGTRCVYLVTELCSGGSLLERLEHQRTKVKQPMLEGHAAAFAEQILSGTSYCHERGVVHRDLKPENVLFLCDRPDSPLKVIDFGLSDTYDRLRKNVTKEMQERTGALGAVARMLPKLPGGLEILSTKVAKEVMQRAGTPHYMAPEVYEGQYSEKADVWSIGVIIFEMLSNRHPFYSQGNTADMVKGRILSPAGADFCDPAWSKVSASAQRACRAALKRDPRKRLSAKDLLGHSWLESTPRLALGVSEMKSSGMASTSSYPSKASFKAEPGLSPRSGGEIGALEVKNALRAFVVGGQAASNKVRLRQAFLRLVARELAEAQLERLRGAFLRLDRDGDGALSVGDLMGALHAKRDVDLGPYDESSASHVDSMTAIIQSLVGDVGGGEAGELRQLMTVAGTSGPALLGFSDFLAVMMPSCLLLGEGQLMDAWSRLDAEGRGRVSRQVLLSALQVGSAVSGEEIETLKAGLPEELSFRHFRELLDVQVNA